MGHWEWERGDFKLPTAEFARVRANVAAADRERKEAIFGLSQQMWKGLTAKEKRDGAAYRDAVSKYVSGLYKGNSHGGFDISAKHVSEEVIQDLESAVTWKNGRRTGTPKRVLAGEMDYPTNRTEVFHGLDVTISFDKKTSSVNYQIPQDRRTIENAHSSYVLGALIKDVLQMRWTRGTGGVVASDDEYAEEARNDNGSYSTDLVQHGYGPIGAQQAPFQTKPWKDPKGDTFHAESVKSYGGQTGRVKKGVPAGGQFTGRFRSEADFRL
jgi:hypothetical protein